MNSVNIQTVEAEIKVTMLPQRARGAVNRVKNKSSNGPLRVQPNDEEQARIKGESGQGLLTSTSNL